MSLQVSRPLRLEVDGEVAIITLARPERRNAIDSALSDELWAAFERVESDPALSVGVIVGDGSSFCAGADLVELADRGSTAGQSRGLVPYVGWTCEVSKPLIAAVNGPAIGAGFALVQSCDLVVASSDAYFQIPEARRGLSTAWAAALPRWVPPRVVMEMVLTAAPMSAARALETGLVNRVVGPEQLMPVALDLARSIAANAQATVRSGRQVVRDAVQGDLNDLMRQAYRTFKPVRSAPDEQRDLQVGRRPNEEKS